uniref:Uncharacterized protein n=1 Tax=Hanusia phi TaxID=3032 RepID=A0A7S0E9D0_9CRYP|mmetsp:Transcript_19569/g.44772  ORF Transcript_19569/g.44772 Transcript_19569/m.44772 type:complete len:704 (+) Transcript_19569:100-2211(+)
MDRGSQGDRFMQMGKFDAAAASYTEALRTSKDLTEIVRLLSSKCDALLSAKRFDEARMEAEQLIKLKPEWSQGHYRLGKAALAMEEFEVAEGAFGKAVELVPGNEKFEQGLKETQVQMAKAMGNAAFKEAAFEEAIQHYTIAIDLNPSHSDVFKLLSNRSACFCHLSQYDKALQDANDVINMEPKWSKGYCRRAAALAGQGSIDQAIAAYQAALPLDPDKATIQSRIDSLGQAKAKVKGNRTSDKGEAQREKSTPPHLKFDDESKNMHLQRESRGYSSQGKGVPENVTLTSPTSRNGGLPMSSSSSQKSPSDEQVKGNKAFEVGDFKAAIEHYSNAILFDPLNHILFSNRSAAYASLRMWDQAIKDSNECVRLQPSWAKGYCRQGVAYEGNGDLRLAEAAYEKGLELDPENALLQISLFRVCVGPARDTKAPPKATAQANERKDTQPLNTAAHKIEEVHTATSSKASADAKMKGNEAFRRKEFSLAVAFFSEALENESDPHVLALLLSNRSATYAQLNLFDLALKDADRCIELRLNWAKGRHRQAIALMGLSNYEEAARSYSKAMELEGKQGEHYEVLLNGYENAQRLAMLSNQMEDPLMKELSKGIQSMSDLHREDSRVAQEPYVGQAKRTNRGRAKKKLSWDTRPPQVFVIHYPPEEITSRKAHWRWIEAEASRMARSAGSVWNGTNDYHPNRTVNNFGVD